MSFSEYFVMSFTLSIGNSDEESETVNIKSNNVKLTIIFMNVEQSPPKIFK